MSSVAETSRVKDDSDEPLSRRRGLRLVACLVENNADKSLAKTKPNGNFNIAICDDMFSASKKREQGTESDPLADLTPQSSEAPQTYSAAKIALTLLAGGILGYLIGTKRK